MRSFRGLYLAPPLNGRSTLGCGKDFWTIAHFRVDQHSWRTADRRAGRAAMINLHVVDLFHGDEVTSFGEAANAGIWGVIHKATTGATGRDDRYASRRTKAADAGLLWG